MSKFRDLLSRRTLATGTSMRNVVICFYIARYWFASTSLPDAVGAHLSLMVPINAVFTLYEKWAQRKLSTESA